MSRSVSLLVRFLAFDVVILRLLGNDTPENLAQLIEATSASDSDAALWILSRLHQVLRCCADTQIYAIRLYVSVIDLTTSRRLKTEAISVLAESLEAVYEYHKQLPAELEFLKGWAISQKFNVEDNCESLWDRQTSNSSMQLEGCLLPLRIDSTTSFEKYDQAKVSLQQYTQSVSIAVADETVRSSVITRLNVYFV